MYQIELDHIEENLQTMLENALRGDEVIITQADLPVLKVIRVETLAEALPELDENDPVFDLIGAFQDTVSLIDGIAFSEDPDLYGVADMMGEAAKHLHAWEIAPSRYAQGSDGRPVRLHAE